MTTFCYCFASGQAYFGAKVPTGAIIIDKQTDHERAIELDRIEAEQRAYDADPQNNPYPRQGWKDSLTAKMRLSYDGKTMLVPGIPEAENQAAGLEALHKFLDWAVRHDR